MGYHKALAIYCVYVYFEALKCKLWKGADLYRLGLPKEDRYLFTSKRVLSNRTASLELPL